MARTIWIVQACADVRGQLVDMFTGAYASLEGARASLERLARQQGKALALGGPGPIVFRAITSKAEVNMLGCVRLHLNEQAEQEPGGTGEPGANLFVGGGRRCWRR